MPPGRALASNQTTPHGTRMVPRPSTSTESLNTTVGVPTQGPCRQGRRLVLTAALHEGIWLMIVAGP